MKRLAQFGNALATIAAIGIIGLMVQRQRLGGEGFVLWANRALHQPDSTGQQAAALVRQTEAARLQFVRGEQAARPPTDARRNQADDDWFFFSLLPLIAQ